MLTIEERTRKADERTEQVLKARRTAEKIAREQKKKKDDRRKYIVGGLVVDAFPDLLSIIPGTQDENEIRFQNLKQFLTELSADLDFMKRVQEMVGVPRGPSG